ncbi:Protein N-acetyltransferase, RimJ/RimL family [Chitinophaga ginsengisegetis]|uniref:Protein N-acetyltransferase, RimJ/RimL family n=1 Tax=Chitinophaga ginsengisegetis TaxID=393003 RepID=A0A1T5P9W4_9BACT|nr:GNAT family N-acetyltransferase [Chitinophaga ginsengisegetis]SKD09393.1 Protein N-acetyltransferase, RimJ/RimL family [Chitinophaga ginsengisegetis]
MKVLFETPRLQVRTFAATDDAFVLELLNTPSWLQYIGDRQIRTLADAQRYIMNNLLRLYAEQGYGAWVVVLKETGKPTGICGLFKRKYLEQPDLGFAFLPAYEGLGYAYEAATATIEYSRQQLPFSRLFAITQQDNHRSVRLLERSGFTLQGTILPPGEVEELMLFDLELGS